VVSDVGGHRKILEDFLHAISMDNKPRCDGYEGRRSLEVAEALYESSRTGQAVTLPVKATQISSGYNIFDEDV
jgi:predicted dehydrogenase